jgi:hypothetical protein
MTDFRRCSSLSYEVGHGRRDEAPSCGALTFAGDWLSLVALDYLNADWASKNEMGICSFVKAKSICGHDEVQWRPSINQAAALDLGRSDWLRLFAQRHLCKCEHYRIMFYDDIICEDIAAAAGAYASATR